MGRGSSGISNSGISRLQDVTRTSRTSDLLSAFDALYPKSMAKMSNEEKMVRAVVMDELLERGNIVFDAKTDEYSKYNKPQQIVNTEDRSYRVNKIETRPVYQGDNNYGDKEFADCEFLFGGKWVEVKNVNTQRKVADLFRKKAR